MTSGAPRLLILEDDERFADTLAAEFRDRSYETLTAHSLTELREVCDAPIHFAIVDLRLQGDNGLDAIAIIRKNSPDARIVVLTGYGSIATAVQATKQGADNYLTKPVDIDKIEQALGMRNGAGLETAVREEYPSRPVPGI